MQHSIHAQRRGQASESLHPQGVTDKIAFHQARRRLTDDKRIRGRQALEAGGDIRCLPERQVLLAPASPDLPHDHEAGMDPHPDGYADPLTLGESAIQRAQHLDQA